MGGFSLVQAGDETVLDYESFFEVLKIETTTSLKQKGNNYRPRFQEPFETAFPKITGKFKTKTRSDFLSSDCHPAVGLVHCTMYYLWWDKPLGVNEPIKVYPSNLDPPKKVIEGAGRRVSIITQILWWLDNLYF